MEQECSLVSSVVPFGAEISCIAQGTDFSRCFTAVGGVDGQLKAYAVNTTNPEKELFKATAPSPPSCLTFEKSDEELAAGAENGLWNVSTGQCSQTLSGHRAQVTSLEYYQYHNTKFICSGANDTTVRLWDPRRRGTINKYSGHTKAVNVLRFSPDGKHLVTGGEDALVKVWDLRTGQCVATKSDSSSPIKDIRFHPTEMMFAAAGGDKQVDFYDFETFERVSYSDKTTHPITTIQFSIGGESLFYLGGETVRQIKWEPYQCLRAWVTPFGKQARMVASHNKIISVGIKTRNELVAFALDLSEESMRPVVQLKKAQIGKPQHSTPSVRSSNQNRNRNNGNNVVEEDPFQSRQKLLRSPPPPSKHHEPDLSPIKPIASSPKKKIIRPTNPKQPDNNHIPVEIFVGPKVINEKAQKVANKKDKPKAIVKPNNSANFDKLKSDALDEKPIVKTMGLRDVISASSTMVTTMQSRNLKLHKAKLMWSRGRIAEVLSSSILDRSTMFDLLTLLLEPDGQCLTLDIALVAADCACELSKSKHSNHLKISIDIIKKILYHFRELIEDAIHARSLLPTLANDERNEKCVLIVKRGNEIRSNLESNDHQRDSKQLHELNLVLDALKS